MNQVRYGVIGLGNMGSAYVEMFAAGQIRNGVLGAVSDRKPERFAQVQAQFSVPPVCYTDYHEMLTGGQVDAVIIALPHYLHPVIAQEAFAAGVHVLTEKPAGVYTKAVREMNKAAAESGLQFGIMFNQRMRPIYRKTHELVQSGAIGAIKRSIWVVTDWYRTQAYYDSGSWRTTWKGEGGGVLLNQCPHNLDLWQWIVGMPTRISAECYVGKYHHIEVEDDVVIHTEYANGATGTFITTTGECPGTNRLEISGDRGKITVEKNTIQLIQLHESERVHCFSSPDPFSVPLYSVTDFTFPETERSHEDLLQNFTDSLLTHTKPEVPGEVGIASLTISNGAYFSAWQGGIWLDLPFDEDRYYEMLQDKIAHSTFQKTVREARFSTKGTYG